MSVLELLRTVLYTRSYDHPLFMTSGPVMIFILSPQEELVGDDTIAVQKVCEECVVLRREKKLVVMLAANGRSGSRCVL